MSACRVRLSAGGVSACQGVGVGLSGGGVCLPEGVYLPEGTPQGDLSAQGVSCLQLSSF